MKENPINPTPETSTFLMCPPSKWAMKRRKDILTGHQPHVGPPFGLLSAAYKLHSPSHTSNSNYYTLYNILQALNTPHVFVMKGGVPRKWAAGHVGTIRT